MDDKKELILKKRNRLSLSRSKNQINHVVTSPMDDKNQQNVVRTTTLESRDVMQEQVPASPMIQVATLLNKRNSCYLNSLIYALRYLADFREHLHDLVSKESRIRKSLKIMDDGELCDISTKVDICVKMHEVFQNMYNFEQNYLLKNDSTISAISPDNLLDNLSKYNRVYEGDHQHDVHELMGCLLTCMERDKSSVTAKRLRNGKKIIKDNTVGLFHGKVILRTVCLECENVMEIADTFWDLEVPLSPKSGNDGHLVALLQGREFLRDDNKIFCQNCRHMNEASRSTQFVHLPNLLVLRARQSTTSFSLSTENIDYHKANVKPCVPTKVPCLLECCPGKNCKIHTYYLRSIICHVGPTYSSGHYTTYVHSESLKQTQPKNKTRGRHQPKSKPDSSSVCCDPVNFQCDDKWLHFDDDKFEILDALPIFDTRHSTAVPYLLFYSKNKFVKI